jgi:hypothetical protein
MKGTIIISFIFLLVSCRQREYELKTDFPFPEQNIAFEGYEDISLPRFDSLKIKNHLRYYISW